MIAALLLLAGCTTLEPPSDEALRRESAASVYSPRRDAIGFPRNGRIVLGPDAGFYLDETEYGPAIMDLTLVNMTTRSVVPHRRDGRFVEVPGLLPPNATIHVVQTPTSAHPCPACVTNGTVRHGFTTSGETQDDVAAYDLGRPFALLAYTPDPSGPPVIDSCGGTDHAYYEVRIRTGQLPAFHEAHIVSGRSGDLHVGYPSEGGSVFEFEARVAVQLAPDEPVFASLHTSNAQGRMELSAAARVAPTVGGGRLFDPEFECRLDAASSIDADATLPRNGVVRVRSFAETWPIVVDDAPLASPEQSPGHVRAWRLPATIAPGTHVLTPGTCATCVCPTCAPEPAALVVDDVVDVEPPEAPRVVVIERAARTPRAAAPTCEAMGAILLVDMEGGVDDHTLPAALVYDVSVTTASGDTIVIGSSLRAEETGVGVRVAAELRGVPLADRARAFEVTVVARDLADNASAPSEPIVVENEIDPRGGCACVAPSTTRAPFALLALPFLALLRRRVRLS